MKKFLIPTLLAVLTSCFLFPFSVSFLPESINSKMILAGIGAFMFIYECLQNKSVILPRMVLGSGLFAVLFSLWCLFCITVNGTSDTTYVDYWVSFGTWMTSAFCLYTLLQKHYVTVDVALITKYLTIVCFAQCIIAIMIDNIPFVKQMVDSVIVQGHEYMERDGRLYGIGVGLDPAGIRFSVVLVMIAHQLCTNLSVISNKKSIAYYIIAFIIIIVIGNMISRTTIVGALLSLLYIAISYIRIQKGGYVSGKQLRFLAIIVSLITIASFIAVMLYNTNAETREYLRFGFEGFFNWAETGEFSTGSTDKLNTMWVWPTDTHTWIYGSGRYGVFEWGSDIGYCLFTLYCGLPGLIIYSAYFIYNHLSLNRKFKNFFFLSLLLIAITFIVWSKVATDIFFIDALLFCIDGDKGIEEPESEEELATEITA